MSNRSLTTACLCLFFVLCNGCDENSSSRTGETQQMEPQRKGDVFSVYIESNSARQPVATISISPQGEISITNTQKPTDVDHLKSALETLKSKPYLPLVVKSYDGEQLEIRSLDVKKGDELYSPAVQEALETDYRFIVESAED